MTNDTTKIIKKHAAPASPYPLGATQYGEDATISAVFHSDGDCGVAFKRTPASKHKELFLFDASMRTGNIFSATIQKANAPYYQLYEDGRYFCDPYARNVYGLEDFGAPVAKDDVCAGFQKDRFDWKGDRRPKIQYEDSVVYCLNVRAFTKSPTSGVDKALRGTYAGVTKKIPYLQSLGVTAVELMPVHEIHTSAPVDAKDTRAALYVDDGAVQSASPKAARANLWGYQEGYYFAPRASYATKPPHGGAPSHAMNEFKEMVRAFHRHGMEVVLQFYFAVGTRASLIIDCIRYWVSEYHIDGVHLKSDNIPVETIVTDPMFNDIKIWSKDAQAATQTDQPAARFQADYGENFMWAARRFLKGDDLSINDFVDAMYGHGGAVAQLHYVCNYDGFSLRDLVTYEHKRNEANGEGGADGRNDNFGWNCGVEGETTRKAVLQLRKRQVLNALTFVFLTRGVPLLYAGDEMYNTQNGNNNPYNQDNRVGWTTWDAKGKNAELTDYVRFLSSLRKSCDVVRRQGEAGRASLGAIPELSFHGADAWKPDFSDTSHSFGVLYADAKKGVYVYVAFNMYWGKTTFALPALPKNKVWRLAADTFLAQPVVQARPVADKPTTECAARSVRIFISEGENAK